MPQDETSDPKTHNIDVSPHKDDAAAAHAYANETAQVGRRISTEVYIFTRPEYQTALRCAFLKGLAKGRVDTMIAMTTDVQREADMRRRFQDEAAAARRRVEQLLHRLKGKYGDDGN